MACTAKLLAGWTGYKLNEFTRLQRCILHFAFFISLTILRIATMIRITSRTIKAGFVALALLPIFCQCAEAQQNSGAKWSWQEPQAKVLPTGDLEWTPKPFQFKRGKSVRYIDFEAGDDSNDGISKENPGSTIPGTRQPRDKRSFVVGFTPTFSNKELPIEANWRLANPALQTIRSF